MFNYVIDGKETFFGHKKFNLSKSQKSHFSKGVNAFGQKMYFFFLEVFSVKIRLEMMFNNALDTKETCFSHKKFSLSTGGPNSRYEGRV